MQVSQVIQIAHDWVQEMASQTPGFCGAYLAGSINQLQEEETFPSYRDVDIYMVVEDLDQVPAQRVKHLYKGCFIEGVFMSLEGHSSSKAILSSPLYAPNIVVGRILADPRGILSNFQQIVEREYSRRRWVKARCQYEKRMALEHLGAMDPKGLADEMFYHLLWFVLGIGGLIAVAHLRPPTVRRCLALSKELLQAQQRADLHEAILATWGCADLTLDEVESCLEQCVWCFDKAVQVIRTPFYGDFDISHDARPYLIEGSYEMLREGYHREAMFWIAIIHYLANKAIQNDGPEEEKSIYQAGFDHTLNLLGLGNVSQRRSRMQSAHDLKTEVFKFADEIVAGYPE
ncbi:MAG: hypothetical protein GXP39_05400 [Chloroflexi bacterium]|nr:hypothetical protein [Chloroflexota bacterium]